MRCGWLTSLDVGARAESERPAEPGWIQSGPARLERCAVSSLKRPPSLQTPEGQRRLQGVERAEGLDVTAELSALSNSPCSLGRRRTVQSLSVRACSRLAPARSERAGTPLRVHMGGGGGQPRGTTATGEASASRTLAASSALLTALLRVHTACAAGDSAV